MRSLQVIRANETMYKAGQMERVILRKLSEADPESECRCRRRARCCCWLFGAAAAATSAAAAPLPPPPPPPPLLRLALQRWTPVHLACPSQHPATLLCRRQAPLHPHAGQL